ncbi:MAG TPA: DUF1800 family protein, partial [Pyrinomonadaceae bacterium]|nr:DUF1800 family protein [Pyrinomonadaceae bacterium]
VKTDPSYGRLRDPAQFVNAFLRAFDAKSLDRTTQSDGFHSDTTSSLDQDIFRPPTVFSYYPPDHEVPGTKLLGPAFAIHSTSTTLRRTNWVNTMVYTGITRSTPTGTPPAVDPGSRPLGTALDLSAWLALAPQPAQLVAELDRVLLHGTMPAAMRASVVKAVEAMPASNPMTVPESVKRAQTAVYLVATSPQYQVQR